MPNNSVDFMKERECSFFHHNIKFWKKRHAPDVIFFIDHESEQELTNLFNTLMQKAFRGELWIK